jgi:protein-tyrosine phosphatase
MIDIHTHILPGIDDGAEDLEESLLMARFAVAEGIHTIIATPHHANGRYDNPAAVVQQKLAELNAALREERIPLTVHAGQEIRVYSDLIEDYHAGHAISLHQSQYILLELPSGEVPSDMEDLLHELQVRRLVPIIAHPERNLEIASKPSILAELVEMGFLSQVTSHSINGLFGRKIQKLSLELCKKKLIHFVSSDAHNMTNRSFGLSAAYLQIRGELGVEQMQYYMNNAERLYRNMPIDVPEPVSGMKKWWRMKVFS